MLIDGFNEACSNKGSSYLKDGYEYMSAMRFRRIPKGDLPHLYHILCNPEPFGMDFKTVAWSVTGDLIFLEIQQGIRG